MEQLIVAVFFILGLSMGSYLNVCAYRIPREKSVTFPPSHCPSCKNPIKPLDNIPVLSYIVLRGKCRACGDKISLRYPAIELITGILWAASYYRFGLSLDLIYGLFFITVLIVLSSIDFSTKTIPNKILLPAMVASILLLLLQPVGVETIPVMNNMGITQSVIGFLAGGGFLFLIAVIAPLIFKKEAMGGGDIKLAAFMGLYLGGYVMLAILLGFFFGAVVGMVLVAKDKTHAKGMIPFGPFLAIGSIITIYFGPQLLSAYLKIAGLSV